MRGGVADLIYRLHNGIEGCGISYRGIGLTAEVIVYRARYARLKSYSAAKIRAAVSVPSPPITTRASMPALRML